MQVGIILMYEKKMVIFIICSCLLSFIFTGCKTTDNGNTARNWELFGKLESTTESLDYAVTNCRAELTDAIERSRKIEDTVERFSYLLGRYDEQIDILLRIIDEERTAVEMLSKNNCSSGNTD